MHRESADGQSYHFKCGAKTCIVEMTYVSILIYTTSLLMQGSDLHSQVDMVFATFQQHPECSPWSVPVGCRRYEHCKNIVVLATMYSHSLEHVNRVLPLRK